MAITWGCTEVSVWLTVAEMVVFQTNLHDGPRGDWFNWFANAGEGS